MRKLKRSIARANMKAAGIGNINRKRVVQTLEGRVTKAGMLRLKAP